MAGPPAEIPPQRPAQDSATTCILWTTAAAAPASLTALLAPRGWPLEVAHDRFSAMAAAACATRAGRRPVLILDEPPGLPGRQELLEALRGRLPDVVIWTFEAARRPQLAGPDAAATSNRPPNGTLQQQVPLRLVDEPADAMNGTEGAADRADLLSPEELDMLLGDEPERGRR